MLRVATQKIRGRMISIRPLILLSMVGRAGIEPATT